MISCFVSFALFFPIYGMVQNAPAPKNSAVVELFEDDADGLLKQLTNPGDGPGKGQAEAGAVFSGKQSLKVTEYQKFNRRIAGWNYAIREKPQPSEYRYLRLAWKSEGATCLMLQLHDVTDWHIRYTAGPNPYGWQTRFLAEKTPAVWNLVTIDLFKDFGERTIMGIAFTTHGGPGCFDHVYLGRTIDDLDRIDANGLAKKNLALKKNELDRLWQELTDEDAAKAYSSFWTLVGGRDSSVSYLKMKVSPPKALDVESKRIHELVRDLNSSVFAVREKASAELRKRLDSALPILEAALTDKASIETRRRIESLIAEMPLRDQERQRRTLALRILAHLEYVKK